MCRQGSRKLVHKLKPEYADSKIIFYREEESVGGFREMYARCIQKITNKQATVEGLQKKYSVEIVDNHQYWKQKKSSDKAEGIWEEIREAVDAGKSIQDEEQFAEIFSAIKSLKGEKNGEETKGGTSCKKVNNRENGRFNFTEILKEILEIDEVSRESEEQFDKGLYCFGLDTYRDIALIEPAEDVEEKQKLDTIVIAIDTSGSCAGDLVKKFFRETRKLFRDIQNFYTIDNIVVLQCDNAIREEKRYTSINAFLDAGEISIKGMGGTDFRPVFERAEQLGREYKMKSLIYFSDGIGRFPQKEASFKTTFIMDHKDRFRTRATIPGWIKTYYFNEMEVEEC